MRSGRAVRRNFSAAQELSYDRLEFPGPFGVEPVAAPLEDMHLGVRYTSPKLPPFLQGDYPVLVSVHNQSWNSDFLQLRFDSPVVVLLLHDVVVRRVAPVPLRAITVRRVVGTQDGVQPVEIQDPFLEVGVAIAVACTVYFDTVSRWSQPVVPRVLLIILRACVH